MRNKAAMISELFPHLFLPQSQERTRVKTITKITRYCIDGDDVASAYAIDASSKRAVVYKNFVHYVNQTDQLDVTDVLKQWLYVSSGITDTCSSYIMQLIAHLDQERHEDIVPSLNVVFTAESAAASHKATLIDSLNYLCRINFSATVYLLLSSDFNIIATKEIDASASIEHAFNIPKPFAPYASLFSNTTSAPILTFHYQSNGDLFLLGHEHYSGRNQCTLLASRRNQKWHCYDMDLLETLFYARFNNNHIGKHLLKIAFELSYEHHGGLIIYDRSNRIDHRHILNPQSSGVKNSSDPFIRNLHAVIRSTPKKALSIAPNMRQILKDIMTLDGCVIFNDEGLMAVGALLSIQTTHPESTIEQALQSAFSSILGGRHAASLYANVLGAMALKISQNGTITFDTRYYNDTVTLEFL